jgi:hypothetical protein
LELTAWKRCFCALAGEDFCVGWVWKKKGQELWPQLYSTKKKNQSEKLRKIALTPTPTPAQVDGLDLLKAQNQESDFIHVSKKCYI